MFENHRSVLCLAALKLVFAAHSPDNDGQIAALRFEGCPFDVRRVNCEVVDPVPNGSFENACVVFAFLARGMACVAITRFQQVLLTDREP